MRTKFWRFAYNDNLLKDIMASGQLIFPGLDLWPAAKNDSEEKIMSSLKVDHFILLANFDSTSETGTVHGVGKVINIKNGEPIIKWKKPIPSWALQPDRRGGVPQWKKEGVFCFDVNSAKRYKLDSLTKKLFQDS